MHAGGYQGEMRSFRRWIKIRLRDGLPQPAAPSSVRPRWKPPSSRQTVKLLTAPSEMLRKDDARFVNALHAAAPLRSLKMCGQSSGVEFCAKFAYYSH